MREPARPWILGPGWRRAAVVLQVVPLPGLGAIIAGNRNPHSGLTGRGVAQLALVVFGSYPLLVPGAVGLAWAVYDAVRIGRFARPPGPGSEPTPDEPPETVAPTPEQKRAERAARREEKRTERAERRAAKREAEEEDETRYVP